MSRTCTICQHPERDAIDKTLVGGRNSLRRIAARFGSSTSAVARHKSRHLPARLAQGAVAIAEAEASDSRGSREVRRDEEIQQAIDIVRQLKAINAACIEILSKARAGGRDAIQLQAVDRIQRQIELQARLIGELQDGQPVQVTVVNSPQWLEIRTVVLRALDPYPEARADVVRALQAAGS